MAKLEITKYSRMPDGSDIILALGHYFDTHFYNDTGRFGDNKFKHNIIIEISHETKEKKTS